ncbi:cytochrome c [Nitrosovibrio sp. Nv17]|jgi:cytochrome c553|uniref:c-type cytochrome n=1 Tax=Nitrosovibrio sp. Nv17 TaxID=1855339 RepID=UPI0009087A7B|nr:cytochrome c [Nitrosovibrio sp. Nv17]SFW27963.1 Cytochrome c553 [Nitrosovibrio sp. Nv17]
MKNYVIAAMSGAVLLASGQGMAGDIEAGKKKAAEICAACHGADGNSPAPTFPRIAGQHASYIQKSLSEYKSGLRKDPIMAGMAATLSQEDIENLAAYYATQSGLQTKY